MIQHGAVIANELTLMPLALTPIASRLWSTGNQGIRLAMIGGVLFAVVAVTDPAAAKAVPGGIVTDVIVSIILTAITAIIKRPTRRPDGKGCVTERSRP